MSRFMPGGGFALPGLQSGVPARTGSPAKRSAAGELDGGLSRFMPGGGFALPGLQSGVPARTGSPAKRSAAGMWLD
ncbi:hypothetical protein [Klebsiella quasipneumoniae]|uniref:hypothetical protein n=2 Tax=Klebsiella quasipneumoniae TaxID=1463165 RepID=UPI00352AE12A